MVKNTLSTQFTWLVAEPAGTCPERTNIKISDNAFKRKYLIFVYDFPYLKPRAATSVINKNFVI